MTSTEEQLRDQLKAAEAHIALLKATVSKLSGVEERAEKAEALLRPRRIDEWREDHGPVLWWHPGEPPYCGGPLYGNWEDYHSWWTPLPDGNLILERVEEGNAAIEMDRAALKKGGE